jgi:hypothetical protein
MVLDSHTNDVNLSGVFSPHETHAFNVVGLPICGSSDRKQLIYAYKLVAKKGKTDFGSWLAGLQKIFTEKPQSKENEIEQRYSYVFSYITRKTNFLLAWYSQRKSPSVSARTDVIKFLLAEINNLLMFVYKEHFSFETIQSIVEN